MGIVIASGYFNPLHKGHIEYLRMAKRLGNKLIVIVNNDEQVEVKGSKKFQDQEERMLIVGSLRYVDSVFLSIDKDKSVCKSIKNIAWTYSNEQVIFAKGGDRNSGNIPEKKVCDELGIKIVDGLGEKIQSSSELLKCQ